MVCSIPCPGRIYSLKFATKYFHKVFSFSPKVGLNNFEKYQTALGNSFKTETKVQLSPPSLQNSTENFGRKKNQRVRNSL